MLRLRAVSALFVCLVATRVFGGSHMWTGSADANFSNPANWIGGSPEGDANADLSFPPGSRLTAQNDVSGLTVRSIALSQANYAISGNPITFTSDAQIIDSSTSQNLGFPGNPNLISADLILTQGLRITKIDFFGNSSLTLSGTISGAGDVWVMGGGSITFGGANANTYSGVTHVLYGQLLLKKPPNTNGVSGELQIGSSGAFQEYAYVTTYENEQIPNGYLLTIDENGELNVGGVETIGALHLIGQARLGTSVSTSPDGQHYIYGQMILGGDITHDGGSAGPAWLSGNFVLPSTRTITSLGSSNGVRITNLSSNASGAGVVLNGTFDLINNVGPSFEIQGTYDGPTVIQGVRLQLTDPNSQAVLHGGAISGSCASISAESGEVSGRSYPGVVSAGDVGLAPATNVVIDVQNPPRIQLNGTLDLGGAQLTVSGSPNQTRQLGQVTTIISNASAAPVVGTFAGYPEGALVNDRWRISYSGGDGNDVTVTEAGVLASYTTLTAMPLSVTVGNSVSLQAQIHAYSTVPFTPTGTVTFSNGATVLDTVPVSNGSASTTVTTLPVGFDQVTAAYSGDAQVAPSQATTSVAVSALPATISAIEPTTVSGATSTTLTIRGSGFLDGATVRIGDPTYAPSYPATFISPTELHVAYNSPGLYSDSHPTGTEVQPGPCCVLSNGVQFTVTAISPPPSSPFVFDAQSVSLPVTPGAMTAWLSTTRRPLGFESQIEMRSRVITDDDNDGLVTWQYSQPLAPFGIWVAADLTTRDLFAAQQTGNTVPPKSPFPQKAFLLDGSGNYSHIALALPPTQDPVWNIMWARPGVGAWKTILGDHGAGDLDLAQNSLLVFDTSSMTPVDASPAPPAGVAAGDLFFGIDFFAQKWFGDRVDDHLAENFGPGVIQFSSPFATYGLEADSVVHIALLRMNGTDGAVSVQYATADGTAIAGVNYVAQAGTITFNAGENVKTIDIPLIDDAVYSGPTSFTIQLSNPAGTTIQGLTSNTVNIWENDPRPVISVQPSVTSVPEGDSGTQQVAFNINLQGSTRKPVTVGWSWVEGLYYNPSHTGHVVFAPGETQKTVMASYTANTVPDGNRAINFSISTDQADATLGTSQASIAIVDDDFATISVADGSVMESAGQFYVHFVLSQPTTKPIHVTYTTSDGTATAGSDYVAKSGTVDVTSPIVLNLSIPILNDTVPEPTERFYLTITAVDGGILGRSTAVITIVDDDGGGAAGPVGFMATANGRSNITASWQPLAGVASYEVQQSTGGGPFSNTVANVSSTSVTLYGAGNLPPDTTYLFRVRALFQDGTLSGFSAVDAATTTVFADDPLVAGATAIKATHIADARRAVNAMRVAAGLPLFTFVDDPLLPGSDFKTDHIAQLRTALDQARSTIGLPPLTYTDPDLAGNTLKAAHINEIRAGCR